MEHALIGIVLEGYSKRKSGLEDQVNTPLLIEKKTFTKRGVVYHSIRGYLVIVGAEVTNA